MIKPSQIREKEFASSTMGGYRKYDVDSFLDEVAVSYEQLYKENSELLKKLRLLVDNIEEYRRREQSGELSCDASCADAREQADKIIADARLEAQRIISEAQTSVAVASEDSQLIDEVRSLRQKEEAALASIRAESERFRRSLLDMYTEHLTLIQSMVDGAPAKKESKKEKIHETKLDIDAMEVDEKFALDDIDSFFADAVSDEQGRIKEAFGGFRFEMGVEATTEEQLGFEETVSDFEESVAEEPVIEEPVTEEPTAKEEQIEVHSEIIVEHPTDDADTQDEEQEQSEDSDEIKPAFKISFPVEDDSTDNEEENIDDLFEEFFKSGKTE